MMGGLSDLAFLRAARARIAAEGMPGLSLRTVAREAGGSLGSLSYRIGDKAALVSRLVAEECAGLDTIHAEWKRRAGTVDCSDPGVLAAIIGAWIDDAVLARRDSAIMLCEFVLEAAVDAAITAPLAPVFAAEDAFWNAIVAAQGPARAALLGAAIAGYCRDELPFAIALAADADYRLLRMATIGRLAEGFAGAARGLAAGFGGLVAACGTDAAAVPLPIDLPSGSKRGELADHIAAIMAERGLSCVSHRLVAARAGVPHSTVAHYFRTRDDLIRGGIAAQILHARRELGGGAMPPADSDAMALIRATHMVALAAARDAALRPYALDMRRRRAENVRSGIGLAIGGPAGLDGAAVQAAAMALIGSALTAPARQRDGRPVLAVQDLARLRSG